MVKGKNLIFIVAYNHENFLEKVISRISRNIAENEQNEILIIDDGSKDKTFFVGEKIKQALSGRVRLTVLKNPVNQGYGGNQKIGYHYAIDNGFDRVFLVHGDGQYAPEMIDDLLSAYLEKGADAVFGTRMASFWSPLKGGMPVYKFIGNKTLTFIQNKILGTKMSEFHSGMRSYSVNLLKKIPFEFNSNDFHFDTEIIIQCKIANAKIVEIPIPTHYGEEICHVNGWKYAWNILKTSIQSRLQEYGFLYDQKFDVYKARPYAFKASPYSVSSKTIKQVSGRVLVLDSRQTELISNLRQKGCSVFSDSKDFMKNPEQVSSLFQSQKYDFVVLDGFLEMVQDPEEFLGHLREAVFTVGGASPVLICSCANIGFFITRVMHFLGEFNYGPRGILNRDHSRLYTRKSFTRLLNSSGFLVEKTQFASMPVTSVLGEHSRLGLLLEWLNSILTNVLPGLFAYQFLMTAKAMPTVDVLLKNSILYSDKLRDQGQEVSTSKPLF